MDTKVTEVSSLWSAGMVLVCTCCTHSSWRNLRPRVLAAIDTSSKKSCKESGLRAIFTRSSAYARTERAIPWCLSGPRGDAMAFAKHLRRISSRARLNRIALRGQPCFTPEWIGIGGVLPIGMSTSVVAPVYTLPIMSIRGLGKPMWDSVANRAVCGVLPNASRMSSQKKYRGLGCRRASLTSESSRKACS